MSVQSKRLRKYIIPSMISNVAFFILTIVDGMFVGNGIGTDALGAVNLAMPFVMLVGAVSALFAIGGVAVAAIRLGRGDNHGANQAFMHSVLEVLVIFTVLSVLGMVFSKQLAEVLGANETYRSMVSDYIFWYALFLVPSGLNTCLGSFCRNDGDPGLATIAALVCTSVNIFGDWLLVFPLQKGVAGAAFATGASQTISAFLILSHFLRKKGKLHFQKFKVEAALYRKIILRGLPEMVSQFAAPITTASMNRVLIGISDPHVNAFSVIGYIGSLFASLMYGLSGGMQPLFGQSYGAKDEKSLRYYLKSGLLMSAVGGIAAWILTFFIGKPVCVLFGAEASAVSIVVDALPKYCLNFVFATTSAVIAAYLFSTKRTQYAIPLNVCRSIVFNFLCINFLPLIFGKDFVWFTVVVAEGICVVIAVTLWKVSERDGIRYR
ncbi:MAG: MATE family efflux transporter [Eubacteriales bacterium]|nr:MATE family efflux transporter [Eubacteriales bacterium]